MLGIRHIQREIKRQRVGRGFSVHSPFAFHFIQTVLHSSLPYYHFESEVKGRVWQGLYRVACEFHPSLVYVSDGEKAAEARRVLALALPHAVFVDSPDKAQLSFCHADCRGLCPITFVVGARFDALLSLDAMVFASRHYAVAIDFPGLPHQFFPVL